jgi:hypothetical protein
MYVWLLRAVTVYFEPSLPTWVSGAEDDPPIITGVPAGSDIFTRVPSSSFPSRSDARTERFLRSFCPPGSSAATTSSKKAGKSSYGNGSLSSVM